MSDVLWLRWFQYRQFDKRQVSDENFLRSAADYATLGKSLPVSNEKVSSSLAPYSDLLPLEAYENVL